MDPIPLIVRYWPPDHPQDVDPLAFAGKLEIVDESLNIKFGDHEIAIDKKIVPELVAKILDEVF